MVVKQLTMMMECDDSNMWVGRCIELDLVTAGPDHWQVWGELLTVCQAQIAFSVEHGAEDHLIRRPSP